MRLSTPRSTAELPTCPATAGNGALATAEPISHAISRTEMTLTAAPPTASTNVAGRATTPRRPKRGEAAAAPPPAGADERGRPPRPPSPHPPPRQRRNELPDHGGKEDHDDRHQRLAGRAVHQCPGDGW